MFRGYIPPSEAGSTGAADDGRARSRLIRFEPVLGECRLRSSLLKRSAFSLSFPGASVDEPFYRRSKEDVKGAKQAKRSLDGRRGKVEKGLRRGKGKLPW